MLDRFYSPRIHEAIRALNARSRPPMTVELGTQAQLTRSCLEERHRRIVARLREIFLA